MDINRNQWFMAGLLLLLLGLQFHLLESAVLTSECTQFLARRLEHPLANAGDSLETLTGSVLPVPPHTIYPPEWLGWALISMGSVLVLHSFSMKKPD